MTQLDNSPFVDKLRLRRAVLAACPARAPVVLESHGGFGRIFDRAWFRASTGVVFDVVEEKAEALARQRPAWRVYQVDSLKAIAGGVARDLAFDIVDLDPYGSSIEYLDALASSDRAWPDCWHLVVNDGLRMALQRGIAWSSPRMRPIVARHGNNLAPIYLRVCRELVDEFALSIGFKVKAWHCYETGANGNMVHYWATLTRRRNPAPRGTT